MLIIPSNLHFAIPAAIVAAFLEVSCEPLIMAAANFIILGYFFADPVFA